MQGKILKITEETAFKSRFLCSFSGFLALTFPKLLLYNGYLTTEQNVKTLIKTSTFAAKGTESLVWWKEVRVAQMEYHFGVAG